jgi:thiol-disulfide isomerase/thioredoxin
VADFKDYVLSDPAVIGTTGRPQMVAFIALKDTASQEMRPIIHALQDEYGTMVDFIYLDADDAKTEAIRKKLAFAGQKPTLIFFDAQGAEKARLTGKQARDAVEGQIEDLLAVGG